MKKFLLIIALMMPMLSFAQEDRFMNVEELIDKEVMLFNVKSIVALNSPFAFSQSGGKMKPINKKTILAGSDTWYLSCKDMVHIKKKAYLRCVNSNQNELYLYFDPKKKSYIDNFKNVTYWKDYVKTLNIIHPYLYSTSFGSRKIEQYRKLEWLNAVIPSTSINDEVKFQALTLNNKNLQEYSYSEVVNTSSSLFKSQEEYDSIAIEQEQEDLRQDSVPLFGILKEEYVYDKANDYKADKGDSIFIYYADQNKIKAFCMGEDVTMGYSSVDIPNQKQLDFLVYRGEKNIDSRKEFAESLSCDYLGRRLDEAIKNYVTAYVEKKLYYDNIEKKQLFLEKQEYVYGEYDDFGLKFRIYNCFKKTIKYIEFTCVPYNAVGDVQGDWVGKRSAKTKGIGPLEPGESASWSFDDMFYDKNDVIRRVRLTNIKFIFKDGSTLNFSGASNIDRHRQ